jgi:PadR family transcriptional regulator PadR
MRRRQQPAAGGDLLAGTLDMLILRSLQSGPVHGLAIAQDIERRSDAVLLVEQGSLYPALYRLEHQGAIASSWGESENKRRAKYYRLTGAGGIRLEAEAEKWNQMAGIIGSILRTRPEEA